MVVVGVPLTLLQLGAQHAHTGVWPSLDLGLAAANCAMACAVYDADRLPANHTWAQALPSRAALLASTAYLASDAFTAPLALPLGALHWHYADLKPHVASYKPLFVAACWVVACFYLPLLREHDLSAFWDGAPPAGMLMHMTGMSNAMDIPDVAEDAAAGVRTPAVRLGAQNAAYATTALVALGAVLHRACAVYDGFDLSYDMLSFGALALAFGGPVRAWAALFALSFVVAGVPDAAVTASATPPDPRMYGVVALLRSTESAHHAAIEMVSQLALHAHEMPELVRRIAIEATSAAMTAGDAVGSQILGLVADLLRETM